MFSRDKLLDKEQMGDESINVKICLPKKTRCYYFLCYEHIKDIVTQDAILTVEHCQNQTILCCLLRKSTCLISPYLIPSTTDKAILLWNIGRVK